MSTPSIAPMSNSIVSPNYKIPFVRGGCDTPETGGIGGNLGKKDKPNPYACEERPTMYDWQKGEVVYADQYLKEHMPNVCYYA